MNKNRVLALLKEANEDLTEGLTEFGVKACRVGFHDFARILNISIIQLNKV